MPINNLNCFSYFVMQNPGQFGDSGGESSEDCSDATVRTSKVCNSATL